MLRFLLPRTLAVASTFSIAFSEPSVAAPPAVDTKVIDPNISIISGTANLHLSQKIVKILNKNLTNVTINKFSDGEININIKESLRGKDVFIIQTCSPPVNESIMELLLSVAAAKRSGKCHIFLCILLVFVVGGGVDGWYPVGWEMMLEAVAGRWTHPSRRRWPESSRSFSFC